LRQLTAFGAGCAVILHVKMPPESVASPAVP
jgi:hypothetical protein